MDRSLGVGGHEGCSGDSCGRDCDAAKVFVLLHPPLGLPWFVNNLAYIARNKPFTVGEASCPQHAA